MTAGGARAEYRPREDPLMTPSPRWLWPLVLGLVLASLAVGPSASQTPARGHGAEAQDIELVGHDDVRGRSAYEPTVHQQLRGQVPSSERYLGGWQSLTETLPGALPLLRNAEKMGMLPEVRRGQSLARFFDTPPACNAISRCSEYP